jgi:hypothetical protein
MAVNPVTAVTAVSNQRGQLLSSFSLVVGIAGKARVNPSSMAQLPLEWRAARDRRGEMAGTAASRPRSNRRVALVNDL